MKLDLLCELDLLSEMIESAALNPRYMFMNISEPEELEDSIDCVISSLDEAIDLLEGYVSLKDDTLDTFKDYLSSKYTFINRLHYEFQTNILESDNPAKIIEFYEKRLLFIMQRIEDDDENLTQTESALASLRRNHGRGLISTLAKEEIERKRYRLTTLWLELFDWIRGDIESAKEGNERPKRKTAQTQAKRLRNKDLNEKEIKGLEKLWRNQTNIRFLEKKGDRFEWVHSVRETGMAYFVNCLYPVRARWEGIETYFGVSNLRSTPYLPKGGQISEDPHDWRHAMTIALR